MSDKICTQLAEMQISEAFVTDKQINGWLRVLLKTSSTNKTIKKTITEILVYKQAIKKMDKRKNARFFRVLDSYSGINLKNKNTSFARQAFNKRISRVKRNLFK